MSSGRQIARDLGVATSVQALAFVTSAVSAFVVPRVMAVETFGYWQLFLFYVGYLGFAQVGLSDGAYLRFGGVERSEIRDTGASSEFWVLLGTQVIVALGLVGLGLALVPGGRAHAVVALGVMLPVFSAKRFLGYLFQAMGETRRFSLSLLVSSLFLALPLILLVLFGHAQVEPYLIVYVIAEAAGLAYCLIYSRGVIQRPPRDLRLAVSDSWVSARVGIKLLVATSAGALILGVARIVVDVRWSIEVFAQVSLAVTLVGFVLTLMAQVSLVLYPVLRRASIDERKAALLHLRRVSVALLPFGYILYFPFAWALSVWLPKYSSGIGLAALLMPICVFDGLMQVLYSTHLKVARRERELMYLNLGAVAIAAVGAVVGGYLLGSVEVVLLSSALAGAVRVGFADWMLRAELGLRWAGAIEANVLVSVIFVTAVWALPMGAALGVVLCVIAAATAIRGPSLMGSLSAIARSVRRDG